MSETPTDARSVILERDLPQPPEKVWRALTEPHLIEEWLMKADFAPVVGHRFTLRADWGTVTCEVLSIEPGRALSYSWVSQGLDSVVTWTLTPSSTGTRLRVEQSGFGAGQHPAYQGAKAGWPRFLAALERVLARPA